VERGKKPEMSSRSYSLIQDVIFPRKDRKMLRLFEEILLDLRILHSQHILQLFLRTKDKKGRRGAGEVTQVLEHLHSKL
jgi:hypothetical protein